MLLHPVLDKMRTLRLTGMIEALSEQHEQHASHNLSFEERLGLLVERELTLRESRRLSVRLKQAKLKQSACMEDIDYKHPRGLDNLLLLRLSQCNWIQAHHNVLLIGPTGTGKTFLACALAHKACLEGFTTQYLRVPRLFNELQLAKGDGRYGKLMQGFAKTDVLILDDWGLAPLTDEQRRDLLELVDDRHGSRSTIVTSQLPIKLWHEAIGDSTLADAILDRLVHNAYKLQLKGESLRKKSTTVCQTQAEVA